MLFDKTPSLPDGVLQMTKALGENRLTWQPQVGVRIAAVIVASDKGFVLAGRSLREVEIRESSAELFAIAGWIASIVGSLVIISVFAFAYSFIKKK